MSCGGDILSCLSLCSYSSKKAPGFEVILGIGAYFWICLCWIGLLFLGYCLVSSGVSESVLAVSPALSVFSAGVIMGECLLVLEAVGSRGQG